MDEIQLESPPGEAHLQSALPLPMGTAVPQPARRRRPWWSIRLALFLAILLHNAQVSDRLIMPLRFALAANAWGYARLLDSLYRKGVVDQDAQQLARVRKILIRLVRVAPAAPAGPRIVWNIHVLNRVANAFSSATGDIAIGRPVLVGLKLTDAETAFVIAHEMSHVLARDILHDYEREIVIERNIRNIETIADLRIPESGSLEELITLFIRLPNERQNERNADQHALQLMQRAGFDPKAAVSFLKKMGAHEREDRSDILATHPSTASRIRSVKKVLHQHAEDSPQS